MDDEDGPYCMEGWGGTVSVQSEHWEENAVACEEVVTEQVVHEEVISMDMSHGVHHEHQYMVDTCEEIPHSMSPSLDQMAAENLIFMAQDGGSVISSIMQIPDMGVEMVEQVATNSSHLHSDHHGYDQQYFECQTVEEVITDDHWPGGVEGVEVVTDQVGPSDVIDEECEIPLPTDQDMYASRPYPCDFCSKRFRKKNNLTTHMVSAHQNDRPHGCNLCGTRYIKKSDLMNHLKVHAYVPQQEENDDEMDNIDDLKFKDLAFPEGLLEESESTSHIKSSVRKRNKTGTKRKRDRKLLDAIPDSKYSTAPHQFDYDEDMRLLTEAAEQHYANNMSVLEPRYPVSDPRKPFVCQHCGVGFAREKALASHARIHGGDSPFECETCGEMFWDAALLREHTRTKHQIHSSNSEYEPENDDESDISDSDSKFGDYYCNTCGMSFHRVELLRRHARLHVKKERGMLDELEGHVCNVCGDSFQEALDLLAHAEVHARFQAHACVLCGERFSDEQSCTLHVQSNHADSLSSNSCLLCGKECKDRRALLKHSWDHTKGREYSCSKCTKTFHNKARLKRHMVSHRNKCVACDICGDEFPDGRSLMNHRHSHSSMSGRQFPCRECGKTFGSRSSQQIHLRIHTGERPYGCRFCWKAFADGGTLRKHERIHTGEKPYACAVCPRAFNQRVVLREHIRSHHSGMNKKGTNLLPYFCDVCSKMFETSSELIQHLIQHSDMNTAMKRQPQVGPRKYKRRRKLKPHEVDRSDYIEDNRKPLKPDSEHDSDHYSDRSPEREVVQKPSPPLKKSNRKVKKQTTKPKPALEEGFDEIFQNFENVLQGFSSLVTNQPKTPKVKKKKEIPPPSRPKMIHTSKTRVAVENAGDGKKKTKTLITRTTPAEFTSNIFRGTTPGERNRPRTKNVSYHSLIPEKLPPAVFPDSHLHSDMERNIFAMATPLNIKSEPRDAEPPALECESPLKDIKGLEKYSSDTLHDLEQILKSPIRTKLNSESSNGTVCNDINIKITKDENIKKAPSKEKEKPQVKNRIVPVLNKIETRNRGIPKRSFKPVRLTKRSAVSNEKNVSIKKECVTSEITIKEEVMEMEVDEVGTVFKCEMCSESFTSRSALLVHVRVHI